MAAPTGQAFVSLPRVRCHERGLGGVQQPGRRLTTFTATVDLLAALCLSCLGWGGRGKGGGGAKGREEGCRGILPAFTPVCQALARTAISGLGLPGTYCMRHFK